MNINITVVIPTHNPNRERLLRTLEALKSQKKSSEEWELIIVDNASSQAEYVASFDISWHANARIIVEPKIGLTNARIAGIKAARSEYVAFVDDDNVLDPSYLENSIEIFQKYPDIGAIGGKSIPKFETLPPEWFGDVNLGLGCRDLGDKRLIYRPNLSIGVDRYPEYSPVGAGMVLRHSAALHYVDSIEKREDRSVLDRAGKRLSSGGDCDINLTILNDGWGIGYFPELSLNHLIPSSRLTRSYLARLNQAVMQSWIKVLDKHSIRPWKPIPKWTIFPRKMKSFLKFRAWKGPAEYIAWKGACGMFEGQSELT